MKPRRATLALALSTLGALGGCQPTPTAAPAPATSSSTAPVVAPGGGAVAALDRMDTRAPVPLLPMMANHQKQNMRDHLVAVQDIILGATAGDFAAVEKAAGRIGFSEQMGQMCTHMGAGAPGFTEQALRFHRTADKVGEAAKKKDREAVWTALGETLQTCTACHAAWKQRVVDEPEWQAATASSAPSMMHHGP